MSQGPIIQPRLVGQATTSSGWMSWWKCPSIAALTGVSWVHGIALGSPVVPDENRTLVTRSGLAGHRVEVVRLAAVCQVGPPQVSVPQPDPGPGVDDDRALRPGVDHLVVHRKLPARPG